LGNLWGIHNDGHRRKQIRHADYVAINQSLPQQEFSVVGSSVSNNE
jgi:hypothetical protein